MNFNMKIERPKSAQPIPPNATKVFKGKLFDVYQWEQTLYDGTIQTFEKVKRPDTVVIIPVLDDKMILLTEQEQPGRGFFVDAPSGRIEEGEEVMHAAQKELIEETGYEAAEYVLWKTEQPLSKIEWVVYVFIAKGCKKVTEKNPDAGEKISIKPVSFQEFLEQAKNKQFRAKELVADLLEALYDEAKKEELKNLFY